jgi:hypothetical protein
MWHANGTVHVAWAISLLEGLDQRVADEDVNSVRDDIVHNDTRFDEFIHRFTKVSLEMALKTGEARSTSPGGSNMLDMVKHDVTSTLDRHLTDGGSWF